jgi:hypothetical protein
MTVSREALCSRLIDSAFAPLYNRGMKALTIIGVLAGEIVIIVAVESFLSSPTMSVGRWILVVGIPLLFVIADIWALIRWILSGK